MLDSRSSLELGGKSRQKIEVSRLHTLIKRLKGRHSDFIGQEAWTSKFHGTHTRATGCGGLEKHVKSKMHTPYKSTLLRI